MHILILSSLFFSKDYESHAELPVKLNFYFFVHWTPKLLNTNIVPIQSFPPAAIVSYSGVDVTLIFSLKSVSNLNDDK